jgi:TetR/AcrR family transcriptional repressor of nem operon
MMTTDTKTSILNSAERAARMRGFDGFSYADLSSDVGVSKASIHHHFATKAVLAVALMQRYHTDLEAACAEIDQEHTTGAARLVALITRYQDALNDGRSLCLCVSFSTSTESLSTEIIIEMNRFRSMMLAWLSKTFIQGKDDGTIQYVVDPVSEAAATLPLLEGAQLTARVAQDALLFEAAVQLLLARLRV